MKKSLIILILLSGAFLTYSLSDFIIDARYVREKTEDELNWEELLDYGPKDKKPRSKKVKYWRFDSSKLPIIFGSSFFLAGCVILFRNDKFRDNILK